MDEAKIQQLEEAVRGLESKIGVLFDAIKEVDSGERRSDFHEKWKDKIAEIEPDQKAIFGEDYNEEDGLWDYHNKHYQEDGYNEDEVIGGYLGKVKEKFDKLKGIAETPEETAMVEQKEEEAEEGVKEAETPAEAEAIIDEKAAEAEAGLEADPSSEEAPKDEEPDEEEVKKALEDDILISL